MGSPGMPNKSQTCQMKQSPGIVSSSPMPGFQWNYHSGGSSTS